MRTIWLLALASFASLPTVAWADASGSVGAGVRLDDNIFRQPAGLPVGSARSDQVYSAIAHGDATFTPDNFDVTLSGDASVSRYAKNSNLDNFSYQVSADVERQPDAVIGMTLTALSRRQLSSFADNATRTRNIQQYTNLGFRVTAPFAGDFRVVAQPLFASNINQAQIFKSSDYRRYGGAGGVGYFSPLGNSVSLTVTHEQTDGLSSRFVTINGAASDQRINLADTSIDASVIYLLSPLTTITAKASYLFRTDRTVLRHNLNGPIGELSVDYHPRESFRVTGTIGRRLETQDSLFVDSVRDIYAQAAARARVIDRVDVDVLASFNARTFVGDTSGLITSVPRKDRLYRIEAGLAYLVLNHVSLGVRGAHEGRNSDLALADYSANTVEVTARYLFGQKK